MIKNGENTRASQKTTNPIERGTLTKAKESNWSKYDLNDNYKKNIEPSEVLNTPIGRSHPSKYPIVSLHPHQSTNESVAVCFPSRKNWWMRNAFVLGCNPYDGKNKVILQDFLISGI